MSTTTTQADSQLCNTPDGRDSAGSSTNQGGEFTHAACRTEPQARNGNEQFFFQVNNVRSMMAFLFSSLFLLLSLVLVLASVYEFMDNVFDESTDLISVSIKSINILVISLAMYELGVGVGKEYINCEPGDNIFFNIRRTITRFVGTVCIAVVLEALIMIIKYSQLDMAGNLFYPVAIMVGGGVLLASLGVFLSMTRGHTE
ncbi:MAG: hypothetical protein OQK98_10635 [Gammaproteobacteria bacterium]|nr:hypothetical protein [Gammaproteobacteria bacterium]